MENTLPERAHTNHLRRQAKDLRRSFKRRDVEAADRIRDHYPKLAKATAEEIFSATIGLQDALLVISREYGFESWPTLKRHIEEERFEDDKAAFIAAVTEGEAREVKRLLKFNGKLRGNIDEPWFYFGSTALLQSASNGNRKLIDALLDAGANINTKSAWKPGPFGALHYVDSELGAYLIERGAEVDAHAAVHLGLIDTVREMVAVDPGIVHAKGGDGQTPLHFAKTVAVAGFLLESESEIEARCVDHESTPAQWMAVDRPQVCRYLLERGACPDIFMAIGLDDCALLDRVIAESPGSLRAHVGQPGKAKGYAGGDIYAYHPSVGAGVNGTPLHACASLCRVEAGKHLLESGADVEERGAYDDCTPLHWASWHNKAAIAELFLDCGADPEARTGEIHDNTALNWAVINGSVAIVRLFIDRKVDLSQQTIKTALKGERGELRKLSHAPLSDYTEIRILLEAAGLDGRKG